MRACAPVIGLLSDFGTRDWYVGTVKAVLLSRCPTARLVDITHEIPPQDTLAGAFTLAAAAPWFPAGSVLLAVVDPGVGTDRAILAGRADDCWLVGPDNGLLALTLARAKRVSLVRVTNRRFWPSTVSQTFHARDIMAPAAAALASGCALRTLGPAVRQAEALAWPVVERRGGTVRGQVMHIDAFGNLITNIPAQLVARAVDPSTRAPALAGGTSLGMSPQAGRGVVLSERSESKDGGTGAPGLPGGLHRPVVQYKRRRVRVVTSYAAGAPRELVAVGGSLGYLELAVRDGSAARMCHAVRGDDVVVTDAPRAHGRG